MEITEKIVQLFSATFEESIERILLLPLSGSSRQYYRINTDTESFIAAYNEDVKENNAFISFTEALLEKQLNVPLVLAVSEDKKMYILEDLGDTTLFSVLNEKRTNEDIPESVIQLYKQTLSQLPKIQVEGAESIDFTQCYPRSAFDKQSMMWDLNYFKYYFLKLAGISFDEQKLEDDFQAFTDYLLTADSNYFLYRDFQSRNIMIFNEQPYFIDYQGGRKGALQYDVASLLYDAKANLPDEVRETLLNHYCNELSNYVIFDREKFHDYYYGFVLIRIMQAMGAYGFRGFYEKKELFLLSIPYAIENMKNILETKSLPIEIPTLWNTLKELCKNEKLMNIAHNKLHVSINSFSYKKGIPQDTSGNGGGFVFDCRLLHNPGKYEQYKQLNGKDEEVIAFLDSEPEVAEYLSNIYGIIDAAVAKYIRRNFTSLMISFGCTGGQHRSVYCAEQVAKHINEKFDVEMKIRHIEQDR